MSNAKHFSVPLTIDVHAEDVLDAQAIVESILQSILNRDSDAVGGGVTDDVGKITGPAHIPDECAICGWDEEGGA